MSRGICLTCVSLSWQQGEYDQAVDNFTKAYNISRALNDDATISVARMLYGIATAHKMTGPYMCHIDQVNERGGFMGRLMDWKDSRTEDINNLDCTSVKCKCKGWMVVGVLLLA